MEKVFGYHMLVFLDFFLKTSALSLYPHFHKTPTDITPSPSPPINEPSQNLFSMILHKSKDYKQRFEVYVQYFYSNNVYILNTSS